MVTACAVCELPPCPGLLARFESLRREPYAWLLDSALPSKRLGRHSFAGADPSLVLRARRGHLALECRRGACPALAPDTDPFEAVRALLPGAPTVGDAPPSPFAGGAVGYLGYELAEATLSLSLHASDDLLLPDLTLLFVDRVLALDHATGALTACALGTGERAATATARARASLEAFLAQLEAPPAPPRVPAPRAPTPPFEFFDAGSYAVAVEEVKQAIAEGNVYQACLSHRLERDHAGDPWALYRRLRRLNPAPFASYLELPEAAILSSSPERFLRVGRDRRVESRPIKGTRPRGCDPAADARLRRALASSEKDRAENLMIVDLVRNDLGRVCDIGSVEVPELMAIESYAAVFQMVSTITGRLAEGRDALDAVRASFPPGSMTGAPKIAAVRILDRLEPVRRGVYSGAIGYFDARGSADLSVVIRTAIVTRGRAHVHAGGGVVADSDPAAEYRESLDKARPLLLALRGGALGEDGSRDQGPSSASTPRSTSAPATHDASGSAR